MSLTSKHTPGPWHKEDYCQTADEITILAADGTYVCSIDCDGCYNESRWAIQRQIESDARLIAAAPDLLKALEALMDINDNGGPFGGEIYHDRVNRVWDNARAVINKAKGGTV